jgi:hypothetical protein
MIYFIGILLAVVLSLLWVRFVNSIFRRKPKPVQSVNKENEFIKWHEILEKKKSEQKAMNDALAKMNENTATRRRKEYPEYLTWCAENKIKPVFFSDKDIDNVIP